MQHTPLQIQGWRSCPTLARDKAHRRSHRIGPNSECLQNEKKRERVSERVSER